jgi:cytochrome c oxidase accessory protein FixG
MDSTKTSLYASEANIQIRAASGRFAKLRLFTMFSLLGGFYALPWLRLNDHPAMLFDIAARRFYVLGGTFVPQDMIYLTGLLIISAFGLFFVTTVAGRVFCGYACPQTVFTQLFTWAEWLFEGDRPKRLKLDRSPWNANKIVKRGSKHLSWIVLAALTGLTFVSYFVPAGELFSQVIHLELAGWALFWSVFYGFATWGNAGFLREQVCKYMCPYARFQSVMFDEDTLLVSYNQPRGEPRKNQAPDPSETGDCIDCTLCVQVCPTGIDIRDGLQYECIACSACIDACDTVMDKIGKPRGLVSYSTARKDNGGSIKIFRPKAIAYGVVFALIVSGFVTALALRSNVEFDIYRDRQQLYTPLQDGQIRNGYQLHITNKQNVAVSLQISAQGGEQNFELYPKNVELQPLESRHLTINIVATHPPAWQDIQLQLITPNGEVMASQDTTFLGPSP